MFNDDEGDEVAEEEGELLSILGDWAEAMKSSTLFVWKLFNKYNNSIFKFK